MEDIFGVSMGVVVVVVGKGLLGLERKRLSCEIFMDEERKRQKIRNRVS